VSAEPGAGHTPEGVVGIITNHSYLDNPTFSGMRNSLLQTFDQIRIIDFHGSIKPKETPPPGTNNENVFDIQKGVAVAFFVKKSGAEKGVWRADVWGTRAEKYQFAANSKLAELTWVKLDPQFPDYMFVSQDRLRQSEFERGVSVTDIFVQHSVGIVTARDSLAIQFDRETLLVKLKKFCALSIEQARNTFKLGKDVRDWKVEWAQKDLLSRELSPNGAIQILYRPFDSRWTYYTGASRGFHCYPRHDVMQHMLKENIALITSRMTKGEQFAHVQVTDRPAEVICMSPETSNNGFVFPLYLYSPPSGGTSSLPDLFGKPDLFAGKERVENLSPNFRSWIDDHYRKHFTAEEIFGFVYAVLHSRTYRERYAEFLRRSFPRIQFPAKVGDFERLSELGRELSRWHLLKGDFGRQLGGYSGTGDNSVTDIHYSDGDQSIYINKTQRFANVPREVWLFYVGGYQVLDRYLRYRTKRKLSLIEISNLEVTINVLAASLQQMKKIDEVYRVAF
jgi:predicted helicase